MYQITAKNFIISPYYKDKRFVLNDIDSTKRHIKAGDYFGTLATILDLKKRGLEEFRDDLIFLQENYKIVKKTKR